MRLIARGGKTDSSGGGCTKSTLDLDRVRIRKYSRFSRLRLTSAVWTGVGSISRLGKAADSMSLDWRTRPSEWWRRRNKISELRHNYCLFSNPNPHGQHVTTWNLYRINSSTTLLYHLRSTSQTTNAPHFETVWYGSRSICQLICNFHSNILSQKKNPRS